jgi:hypothetical protein
MQLGARVVAWPSVVTPKLPAVAIGEVSERFNASGRAKPAIVNALSSDLAVINATHADAALSAVALEGFAASQRALHIYTNELPPRGSMKGDALRAYAQQLDRALGALAHAHPDHLIVICSPSAVVPPELPANAYALAMRAITAEEPGADDGFLLVDGPATAHRENPSAAYVVDVVPTVLFAAGLPVGRDMDGRIVTDAFTDEMIRRSAVSVIQTYEAERVVVRRAGG